MCVGVGIWGMCRVLRYMGTLYDHHSHLVQRAESTAAHIRVRSGVRGREQGQERHGDRDILARVGAEIRKGRPTWVFMSTKLPQRPHHTTTDHHSNRPRCALGVVGVRGCGAEYDRYAQINGHDFQCIDSCASWPAYPSHPQLLQSPHPLIALSSRFG